MELLEKLGLVIIGWLLGLATTATQKRLRVRSLKTALEREISDARGWLLNSKRHLEFMIQLSVVGETASHGPVKIPVHIYKNNFAEATLKLNEGERGSFHAIYTRIDELNEQYTRLIELNRICGDDKSRMRELAGELELYYHKTCMTLHLIGFHLDHRKKLDKVFHDAPELGEERYRKINEVIDSRLMELANEARKLGPAKVRENDPELHTSKR